MAKYHDLVEEYANHIDHLKAAYADYEKLMARARELQNMDPSHPEFDEYMYDWVSAGELYDEIQAMEHELYDQICREYELVPFVQARNQGISGFYREADLPLRR